MGCNVGLGVGWGEGWRAGFGVGCSESRGVGCGLGRDVGCGVGRGVGRGNGKTLGGSMGRTVGAIDAEGEGARIGERVLQGDNPVSEYKLATQELQTVFEDMLHDAEMYCPAPQDAQPEQPVLPAVIVN